MYMHARDIPGPVYSRVKHGRKHRVDFATDPCRKFVLLRIPGILLYPPGIPMFFGITSCICGEPAVRLCRCSAAANPLVYFGRIHFDGSTSRDTAIRYVYTKVWGGLYLSFSSQEVLRETGNPVIYRNVTRG